jgi:hypothetical protein
MMKHDVLDDAMPTITQGNAELEFEFLAMVQESTNSCVIFGGFCCQSWLATSLRGFLVHILSRGRSR